MITTSIQSRHPFGEEGLGIAPFIVTAGINTITSLIGGNQGKKQAEREKELLLIEQQIVDTNNAATLATERMRLEAAKLQASSLSPVTDEANGMSQGLKATLIASALGIATLGIILINRVKNKPLNGLVDSLE